MTRTRRPGRRYLIRLGVAIGAYAVLLIIALLTRPLVPPPWSMVIMALPAPALLAVGWAVWRYLRETDEMLRRDLIESLAVGFGIGSVLTFSYGLLQLGGAPDLPWTLVWVVYAAGWLLARLLQPLLRR